MKLLHRIVWPHLISLLVVVACLRGCSIRVTFFSLLICSCNGCSLNFCLKVSSFQVSQIQSGQLNMKSLLQMHLDLIIQRQRCSYITAM